MELVSTELRRTYWSHTSSNVIKGTNRIFYPEGPKLDLKGKDYDDYYTPKTRWITYIKEDLLSSFEDLESMDKDLVAAEVRSNRKLGYDRIVAEESEALV